MWAKWTNKFVHLLQACLQNYECACVQEKLAKHVSSDYAEIAPVGHVSAHAPQSMQEAGSIS